MKRLILIILVALVFIFSFFHPCSAKANGYYVFGGAFAYNDGDNGTEPDYDGLSPNGYFGIKYMYEFDDFIYVQAGLKHETSMSYREVGYGFNGVFFDVNLKLF